MQSCFSVPAAGGGISAGCLIGGRPASADETGIVGTVLLGPVAPGPAHADGSDETPFRASFQVRASGKIVARFESDEFGRFRVVLPPGRYMVVPDESAPMPYPARQATEVMVPEEGFVEVTLRFDTGMR